MMNSAEPTRKPQMAPEGTELAPRRHAIAGVVVADDVLLGVIILADDGKLADVKARLAQLIDGLFGLGVTVIYGYDCVVVHS